MLFHTLWRTARCPQSKRERKSLLYVLDETILSAFLIVYLSCNVIKKFSAMRRMRGGRQGLPPIGANLSS